MLPLDLAIERRGGDAAKDWLANTGYDPMYGARPLKRAIQCYVQDPLALKILSGEFREGDLISVEADREGLYFEREKVTTQTP